MPLFKHSDPAPPPAAASPRSSISTRHSLFSGRRSSAETDATSTTSTNTHRSGSHKFFGGSGSGHGILNREDPSVAAARSRVAQAEAAEREADQAKLQAGRAVRDAREHVKRVEAEAAEEARLAKIKQKSVGEIGKRAKPLGRHGIAR